MKTSESIKNLAPALLKAQKETGAAVKGSKNPFFKSKYADLPTVMETVKDALNNNGLLILQPPMHRDGKNFIETVIIHAESGEWASSETEVICAKQGDPQAFGAAQTYARRFGLQAMKFIPAEDDDGNTAAGHTTSKATSAKATKTTSVTVETPAGATSSNPNPVAGPKIEESVVPEANTPPVVTATPLRKSTFNKNKTKTAPTATPAASADVEY